MIRKDKSERKKERWYFWGSHQIWSDRHGHQFFSQKQFLENSWVTPADKTKQDTKNLVLMLNSEFAAAFIMSCLYLGRSCSTAVEHTTHNQEVIGLNPIWYWVFFSYISIFRRELLFQVPHRGTEQPISLKNAQVCRLRWQGKLIMRRIVAKEKVFFI